MSKNRSKKKFVFVVIILICLILAGALLYKHHKDSNTSDKTNDDGFTSKPIYTPPTNATPRQTSTTNSNPGGAVDNNGATSTSLPPQSEWNVSKDGQITLQEPTTNSTVSSGDKLIGTAKVNQVGFILVDNSVGLIAQGTLKVVNGVFSGTLEFSSHSSNGTLSVYYPNPNNGAEESIIKINVQF